jgi:hypothetical protein
MDIKKLKKFLQVFKNILEEHFYKFPKRICLEIFGTHRIIESF